MIAWEAEASGEVDLVPGLLEDGRGLQGRSGLKVLKGTVHEKKRNFTVDSSKSGDTYFLDRSREKITVNSGILII